MSSDLNQNRNITRVMDGKSGLGRTSDPVLGKVLDRLAKLTGEGGAEQHQGGEGGCENTSLGDSWGVLFQ